jgi:hypothetical protein
MPADFERIAMVVGALWVGVVGSFVWWRLRASRSAALGRSGASEPPPLTGYKSQQWTNASATLAGVDVHIRRNATLEGEDSKLFPYTVLINLLYPDEESDDSASEEQLTRLDRAEEAIADAFEAGLGARFGLCVTGGGTRDLFLFVASLPSAAQVTNLIEAAAPGVAHEFERLHDPEWRPYRDLADEPSPPGPLH